MAKFRHIWSPYSAVLAELQLIGAKELMAGISYLAEGSRAPPDGPDSAAALENFGAKI